jgi:hypothetical protein
MRRHRFSHESQLSLSTNYSLFSFSTYVFIQVLDNPSHSPMCSFTKCNHLILLMLSHTHSFIHYAIVAVSGGGRNSTSDWQTEWCHRPAANRNSGAMMSHLSRSRKYVFDLILFNALRSLPKILFNCGSELDMHIAHIHHKNWLLSFPPNREPGFWTLHNHDYNYNFANRNHFRQSVSMYVVSNCWTSVRSVDETLCGQ